MKRLTAIYRYAMSNCVFTRTKAFSAIAIVLLLATNIGLQATITLPAIPSNAELAKTYEYNTEFAFRVKYGADFLESGAVIAYINNSIRGAQTESVTFPLTGDKIYKVRIYGNQTSGDIITIRYYDIFNDRILDITGTIDFVPNQTPDYGHPTILTAYCPVIATSNLLAPANNATDQPTSLNFSWQASTNTTHYHLLLWDTDENRPTTPYRSNIYGLGTTAYNLQYDNTYNWQIISANACSTDTGEVFSFSTRKLPDLVASQITVPDNIQSATTINIGYTISNQGQGGTVEYSWYDGVYISTDATYDNNDTYLGRVYRNQTVAAGANYTASLDIDIPPTFSGNYYLIVRTDFYSNVAESNDLNNTFVQPQPLVVNLRPLPDIAVSAVSANKTTVQPSDSLVISWTVTNLGASVAEGGWTEKLSLNTLTGIKIQLSGTPSYTSNLDASASVQRQYKVKLPASLPFSGQTFLEVELFPSAKLIEQPNAPNNNAVVSLNPITIGSQLYLSFPTSSIAENSTSSLNCYVSRSSNSALPLEVTLSASPNGQVTLPTKVTIPANSYSAVFNLSPIDNAVLDGARNITIQATAPDHNDTTFVLSVYDNEVVSLSAQLSKTIGTEGETADLTISRNLVTDQSIAVTLAASSSTQLQFANQVTIPANEASVTTTVTIKNDLIPELNANVIITGVANGLNAARDTIMVIDNDVPTFTFEILSDTVSESAGAYASWAVIRKTGDPMQRITVNLSSDVPSAVFYPTSVVLPEGTVEKQINIGVVDNAMVDGFRTINVTGALYLSSCNCTTSAGNGGAVTDKMVIADNDGPTLSLTVDPVSLAEGRENAGTLTVHRNTPPDNDLTVLLGHNDATELQLPASVIIPNGKTSATAAITTINDNEEDGNQMVTVTAQAQGYSPGSLWVYVTDQNKCDLTPTSFKVNDDTVSTGAFFNVECVIKNKGYAKAPSGVVVEAYLSKNNSLDDNDEVIGTYTTASTIAIGDSLVLHDLAIANTQTGNYYILLKINPKSAVTELVYINNQTNALPLTIVPNYGGTATVGEEQFLQNQNVTVYGSSADRNGNLKPNSALDVYLLCNGIRRVIKVTTDETGNYITTFTPLPNEAGHFVIGACFPDQQLSIAQDEFDILGMKRSPSQYLVWEVLLDNDFPGTIQVQNLSNAPLTNITLSTAQLPNGLVLDIDTIDTLPGGGTAQFTYNVRGTALSTGKNYEQIPFQMSSDEGATFDFLTFYYCKAPSSHLKSIPASINTTMTKGKSRLYEVLIYNDGAGQSGQTVVTLPKVDWMTLVSPDTIDNILPGDTIAVTLQLTPTEDVPLNAPISGNIAANVKFGSGLSIPYQIEAVSEATGNLLVDVVDDYTYYTAEAPHVANAHVVVRHPFSGKVIAEGFTAADGTFAVNNIPEGTYRITVEADKHEGYQNAVVIDPGRTNGLSVFLGFQAISYTWEVIPTEIEDRYQIDLIMEFETNVPVPVVIIEMPKVMPQLIGDETYTFMVTLTNKGLITANDVGLTLPTDPEYEFITNYQTMDLLAQQAVQVPVVMRRIDAYQGSSSGLKSATATQATGNCQDVTVVVYSIICGDNNRWQQGSAMFSYTGRSCTGTGGIGGWGGWGGWGGGGGYPYYGGGGGDVGTGSTTPSVITPLPGCKDCLKEIALTIVGFIPVYGNSISCGISLGLEPNLTSVAECIIGYIPVLGNIYGLGKTFLVCLGSGLGSLGGGVGGSSGAPAATESVPPILKQAGNDMYCVQRHIEAHYAYMDQYFMGIDWKNKESFNDFAALASPMVDNKQAFTPEQVTAIKSAMNGLDIAPAEIDLFVTRWNQTMEAWGKGIYSPTDEYKNIVDKEVLNQSTLVVDSVDQYVKGRGFTNVGELYDEALKSINQEIEGSAGAVCASVTIKISQTMALTREAFEGTLTILNGSKTAAMEEIGINLVIKDEEGNLSNDLFHIETKAVDILTAVDGTGTLGAEQKGSATILFIPERGAAPTTPKSYSFGGDFSYLDPFTGTKITKPLFPVTLEVHPSPDLFLHYFMQRDILGDDPLTEPIEPIVPAELAVMIENNGYGMAKNVRIESAQPEIIDNEKGLAIHFALVASNLQGQPAQLGLTNILFGNIDPMKTKIGQWWFTSDLMGHFINYEASVTHLDSRGNPDLSLVSGAEMHELIRSVKVYGGNDDGVGDFLVNTVQDAQELPDQIYLSQGSVVLDVFPATNATSTGLVSSGTTSLYISPSDIGWNYIKTNDPGMGMYSIESVTRVNDGFNVPLDNVWLTHVTLPDGKKPIYESKLHFVDNFATTDEIRYNIKWKVNAGISPYIVSITGAPTTMVTEQVKHLTVKFSKPIDAATFTHEDMTLRLQGGSNIMSSAVVITPIDAYTFDIDLSALTIGDGYYALNVQAAQVADQFGILGKTGKQTSWTQFVGVPAIKTVTGLPENGSGAPFDELKLEFNLPIKAPSVKAERFALTCNGQPVAGTLTVTPLATDKEFSLTGLANLMTTDGKYVLSVDLTGIETTDGVKGMVAQTIEWRIDTTPPVVTDIKPSAVNGFDRQHYTQIEVVFSEPVTNFGIEMLELWLGTLRQPLSQLHLDKVNDTTYLISQFRLLTYSEGFYTFKIHTEEITDNAGILGTDTTEYKWEVNRTLPPVVENLRITPDLGFAATDGITSTKQVSAVMTVPEAGNDIELYVNDNGKLTLLNSKAGAPQGELSLPVQLPFSGKMTLEAHTINQLQNHSVASIPLYVDDVPLTAILKGAPTTASKSHPDTLWIEFPERLLESSISPNLLSIAYNNNPGTLTGINITKKSETLYAITGLADYPMTAGTYKLGMSLGSLHKYTSGMPGSGTITVIWQLKDINQAPVAYAGVDLVITQAGTYTLNGTGSSDPDNDAITYMWYPQVGIVLNDATLPSPEFTVNGSTPDGIYTVLLTVSDGKQTHTDKVTVTVALTTGINMPFDNPCTMVFPNPTKGVVHIQSNGDNITRLQVLDANGRCVHDEPAIANARLTDLNLGHLDQGLYYLRVFYNNKVQIHKLVVVP